jgi:hypothetical protein
VSLRREGTGYKIPKERKRGDLGATTSCTILCNPYENERDDFWAMLEGDKAQI